MKHWIKLAVTATALAAVLAWLVWPSPMMPTPACHVSGSAVMAQDRPKEEEPEEGNPSHKEPEHGCNGTGSPEKGEKRVQCKCAKHRKCDGTEPKSCKSWCFKWMCFCENRCE